MEKLIIILDDTDLSAAFDAYLASTDNSWLAAAKVFTASAQKQVDEWMARNVAENSVFEVGKIYALQEGGTIKVERVYHIGARGALARFKELTNE